MSGSFPSLMSVYSQEDTNIYNHALSRTDTASDQLRFSRFTLNPNQPVLDTGARFVERRASLTSTTSYSTESSPTTTNSTFDSPLMASQSPDSSPESASSAIPPKAFHRPLMRSAGTQTMDSYGERQSRFMLKPVFAPEQTMEESKRNTRNLTLDMKLPNLIKPGGGGSNNLQPFSAPTSPLRDGPKTGRRKPTNLTIRTPGFNQLSFGTNPLSIPPTPGQKVSLHQAQSSPSLPLLVSPTVGPGGGMRLTLPNIAQTLKRDSTSGNSGLPGANLPSLREEPYQPPKSQEAPERGYTNGPCLIYDAGIYLYLEPTAEEAAKFDTVINVAKEIKNPFELSADENNTVVSVWRNAGNRQSIIEPQTAMSEMSFKSAFEWPSHSDPTTPTTPRPASILQIKKPEYLHVRWDHNSEILGDLYPLCRIIDARIQQGRKVLVHCQLGVSRSASLIIAYGLYKGYQPDFHSMYMTVKERSRWVGPNMSLIYQLTDFKSKCDQGAYTDEAQQPKPEWFIYNNKSSYVPTTKAQHAQENTQISKIELTSDSRPALRLNKELPPVPLFPSESKILSPLNPPIVSERFQTAKRLPIETDGPSNPTRRAVPRVLPFRAMGYNSEQMAIPPHRPRIVPGLTFAQPSMDLAMRDVPEAPSLFSPRATEFMAAPFGVTTAGDLVTSTPKTVKPPPGAFPGGSEWRNSLFMTQDIQSILSTTATSKPAVHDPRSPHHDSEAKEIFRSIDGVL